MMAKQHRGEVVKEAVLKSGVKITKLCEALTISRPTLYRRFEEPNLSFEFIEQVGVLIRHDFAQEFRELAPPANVVAEPTASYQLDSLDDCKNKLLHVYGLYTALQEKYAALLAERIQ
jgi:hypothetical protein